MEEWDNIKVGDIVRWNHKDHFHQVKVTDKQEENTTFSGIFTNSSDKKNIGIERTLFPKTSYYLWDKDISYVDSLIKALDILEDK